MSDSLRHPGDGLARALTRRHHRIRQRHRRTRQRHHRTRQRHRRTRQRRQRPQKENNLRLSYAGPA